MIVLLVSLSSCRGDSSFAENYSVKGIICNIGDSFKWFFKDCTPSYFSSVKHVFSMFSSIKACWEASTLISIITAILMAIFLTIVILAIVFVIIVGYLILLLVFLVIFVILIFVGIIGIIFILLSMLILGT